MVGCSYCQDSIFQCLKCILFKIYRHKAVGVSPQQILDCGVDRVQSDTFLAHRNSQMKNNYRDRSWVLDTIHFVSSVKETLWRTRFLSLGAKGMFKTKREELCGRLIMCLSSSPVTSLHFTYSVESVSNKNIYFIRKTTQTTITLPTKMFPFLYFLFIHQNIVKLNCYQILIKYSC